MFHGETLPGMLEDDVILERDILTTKHILTDLTLVLANVSIFCI